MRSSPELADEIGRFFDNLDVLCFPYPFAKPLLKSIYHHGFHIYILSNYNAAFFDRDREGFAFLDYCDGEVISGKEKLAKPDEAIFRVLIDRYRLDPKKCVLIDDNAENCHTAERLGMKTIRSEDQADIHWGLFLITGIRFWEES